MKAAESFIFSWINFSALVVILFLLLRRHIMEFLMGRREKIRIQIEDARNKYNTTNEKHLEATKKVENTTMEALNIKNSLIEAGKYSSNVLVQSALEMAERIKTEAKTLGDYEITKARESMVKNTLSSAFDDAYNILLSDASKYDQKELLEKSINEVKKSVIRT